MLFSLVGTIFRALKGWVARVCPDVLGGYCPGKMGGKRPFAAGTIKVCYARQSGKKDARDSTYDKSYNIG